MKLLIVFRLWTCGPFISSGPTNDELLFISYQIMGQAHKRIMGWATIYGVIILRNNNSFFSLQQEQEFAQLKFIFPQNSSSEFVQNQRNERKQNQTPRRPLSSSSSAPAPTFVYLQLISSKVNTHFPSNQVHIRFQGKIHL